MKILLTGATDYVGHQLAMKLASENVLVHALVKNPSSDKIPIHKNILALKGDICDYESVEKSIKGCDFVFHTENYSNLNDKKIDEFYKYNVQGTENILKASLCHNVKKVIYTSTLSVFGPSYKEIPITENQPRLITYSNDFELTKSISEELVIKYTKMGLSCTILNVSTVYGPVINSVSNYTNTVIKKIDNNYIKIVPSEHDEIANYVFIDDVVNANLLAMNQENTHERYIIGGHNLSNELFSETVKNLTKSKIKIIKINYAFFKMYFKCIDFFRNIFGSSTGIYLRETNPHFIHSVCSSEKAITDLGYKITPINIGLSQTINSLKKQS